jgi:outer membrane protein assembly factor BamE (lipoprotein component of BamABCDE complex)
MNTKNIIAIGLATALCGCSALQQTSSQPQTTPTASPSTSSTAQNNQQPTSTADGRSIQKVHVGKIDGEIIGTPAKNSKFAKVRIGMGQREVQDLIGTPNDSHTYTTGKAFIPFYFGKDAYRIQTFYKKEGSLTFEGGGVSGSSGVLIRVSVDPTADGYAHDGQ